MLVLHRQQVLVQVRVPVVVYGVCSDKYLRGREHNPHTHTRFPSMFVITKIAQHGTTVALALHPRALL